MKFVITFIVVCSFGGLLGCGPTYVRGSEMEGLDEYAMSTGLDKRDLEKLFDENIKSLMESAVVEKWKAEPEPPVVSIFPIVNETTEHVREQLERRGPLSRDRQTGKLGAVLSRLCLLRAVSQRVRQGKEVQTTRRGFSRLSAGRLSAD